MFSLAQPQFQVLTWRDNNLREVLITMADALHPIPIHRPNNRAVHPATIIKLVRPQLVTVGWLLGLSLSVSKNMRDAMLRVHDCSWCQGSCNPATHLWDPAQLIEPDTVGAPPQPSHNSLPSLASLVMATTPSRPINNDSLDFIESLDATPVMPVLHPHFSSLNAIPMTAVFQAIRIFLNGDSPNARPTMYLNELSIAHLFLLPNHLEVPFPAEATREFLINLIGNILPDYMNCNFCPNGLCSAVTHLFYMQELDYWDHQACLACQSDDQPDQHSKPSALAQSHRSYLSSAGTILTTDETTGTSFHCP
jgi:hypothetical protein